MITKKYYKLIRVSHADEGYFYIKNISNEVGEFKINTYNSGTLEYSLDGVTWASYNLSTKPTVNVNPGSNIYLRGTNFRNEGNTYISVIDFTKNYNVGGNVFSITNYSTMGSVTKTTKTVNSLCRLFLGQSNLISAQNLNFGQLTTVGAYTMNGFFSECTSLIAIPDFSNIASIEQSGFNEFFYDCSSLAVIPDFSNVTSLGENALSGSFMNCTSLTTGPNLSNITSINSRSLENCFNGCTNISNVTTPNISDLTQNYVLYNWLNGAGSQATGTKVVNVPTGATITTGSTSGIPTGWTRVDY